MAKAPNSQSTVVLVLANERSKKTNAYKASLPLKGVTMLEFITSIAINLAVGPVFIIAGKRLSQPDLPSNKVTRLKDDSADQSHYTGIATALHELRKNKVLPKRLLVVTCTHPYLTIGHLHRLLKKHDPDKADFVLSEYGRQEYLPAVISKSVFGEFHLDNKERDLALVFKRSNFKRTAVMLPNGTIDIDSREEYLNRLTQ